MLSSLIKLAPGLLLLLLLGGVLTITDFFLQAPGFAWHAFSLFAAGSVSGLPCQAGLTLTTGQLSLSLVAGRVAPLRSVFY